MGGYFNEFRRDGITVMLVMQLRAAVTAALETSGMDAKEVKALTSNGSGERFRQWYSDKENGLACALMGADGVLNRVIIRPPEAPDSRHPNVPEGSRLSFQTSNIQMHALGKYPRNVPIPQWCRCE